MRAKESTAKGHAAALLLALLGLALVVAAAPAAARPVSDFFPEENALGSAGDQFFESPVSPAGVAVNNASGDIYVVDRGNNRVEQFAYDNNNNVIRAWGADVVASGPGNKAPVNEVQSLKVLAFSGTFTLTFSGQSTAALPFNVPASDGLAGADVSGAKVALFGPEAFGRSGTFAVTG